MRRKISLDRKTELILAWAFGVIFGLVFGLIFGHTGQACAAEPTTGSFYQWTDEDGVVSFTDDVKRIPSRYVDRATHRTWAEVHASVEKRFTPESTSYPPHVWAETVLGVPQGTEVEGPADSLIHATTSLRGQTRTVTRELKAGGGKIVVVKERRTVDMINSEYYVAYDQNGAEIAVSKTPIIVQINQ